MTKTIEVSEDQIKEALERAGFRVIPWEPTEEHFKRQAQQIADYIDAEALKLAAIASARAAVK